MFYYIYFLCIILSISTKISYVNKDNYNLKEVILQIQMSNYNVQERMSPLENEVKQLCIMSA